MKGFEVEVLSVSRNADIETGKPSSAVVFGNFIDSSPEVKERVAAGGQTPQPDKTIANRFIIFFPDLEVPPYLVGTKWVLNVEKDGEIKITKLKEK